MAERQQAIDAQSAAVGSGEKEDLPVITRRRFLCVASVGGVGALFGCSSRPAAPDYEKLGAEIAKSIISSMPSATPVPRLADFFSAGRDSGAVEDRVAAQATVTPTATGTATPKPTEIPPTATPRPTEMTVVSAFEGLKPITRGDKRGDLVFTEGVEETGVEKKHSLDIARGDYKNTLGLGTEIFLAEPGALLVGPDFDVAKLRAAGEYNDYFNPINQDVLRTLGPEFANTPEGGFLLSTGRQMSVEVAGRRFHLNGRDGHIWFLIVKGFFRDGKRDSDLNSTAMFRNYVPGHHQVVMYRSGGFISEGQFNQMTETAHNGGTNCGYEGCTKVSAFMHDLNTGATAAITKPDVKANWQPLFTNWTRPTSYSRSRREFFKFLTNIG